jgi:hypothetical protein
MNVKCLRQGRTPGGRNERIYENTCRIMMRRFPPGERKINYTHIINGRNVFVKRNGSRERREIFFLRRDKGKTFLRRYKGKISCEAPGGKKIGGTGGGNLWHWTHFFLWYIGE